MTLDLWGLCRGLCPPPRHSANLPDDRPTTRLIAVAVAAPGCVGGRLTRLHRVKQSRSCSSVSASSRGLEQRRAAGNVYEEQQEHTPACFNSRQGLEATETSDSTTGEPGFTFIQFATALSGSVAGQRTAVWNLKATQRRLLAFSLLQPEEGRNQISSASQWRHPF